MHHKRGPNLEFGLNIMLSHDAADCSIILLLQLARDLGSVLAYRIGFQNSFIERLVICWYKVDTIDLIIELAKDFF